MSKALFNPKYIESKGSKTLNTANVDRFVWSHASWSLKVNEVKKFPDEVAQAMLRQVSFLIEVTPKNIAEIRKMQEEKRFKCEECGFETDTRLALSGHRRSHGATPESEKFMSEIEEANPNRTYKEYKAPEKIVMTPEAGAGVPDTSGGEVKDKDGVDWYGPGQETDKPE